MNYLQAIIQFYLYSHLHIAICALALTIFSQLAVIHTIDPVFTSFIFAGTLCQYAIHRLIGILKLEENELDGRFAIIHKFKSHISFYAVLAAAAAAYYFYHISLSQKTLSIIPIILSAAYVLPLLPGSKRLRDLPLVKIFLIATCWSFFTLIIPFYGFVDINLLLWLSFERFIFILAISIPFDLRDEQIDRKKKLVTIVTLLGRNKAILLSYILFSISAFVLLYSKVTSLITPYYFFPLVISYIVAILLVANITRDKDDSYYTGWIDGVMTLPLILCLLGNQYF